MLTKQIYESKIVNQLHHMETQETFVKLLESGYPMLMNAVDAMPADKFDWKPEATSRSAKQLFTECAIMFALSAGVLATREMPSYDEEAARFEGKNLKEMETMARENLDKLVATIKAFPTKDLDAEVVLPWAKQTYFDSMSYPYWNLMWHTGQINYIQTLYGDSEMH